MIDKTINNEHIRLKILNWVESGFLNYGYRNFSMDEIANELHISKKTIYKIFSTKEELIRAAIINQLSNPYSNVIKILKDESDIIVKFIDLSVLVEKYYTVFNDISLAKLRHNFRNLADYIDQFRIQRIIPQINLLLRNGKEKELILDIPEEIIIKVFTAALGAIAASKSNGLSVYSYHQTFRQAFDILLNGILTKKGKQILTYKLEVNK